MFEKIQKRLKSSDSFVSLTLGIAVVLLIGTLIFTYVTRKQTQTAQQQEEQKTQESTKSLPKTYSVAAGDTLWSIAEKYYQSGYNWKDIADANKLADAGAIEVGQTLIIPIATPIVPQGEQISAATTETKQTPKTYTVAHGDTLWSIAVHEYNDGYKWVDIARANTLTNPNLIHAGNVLTLL